MWPPESDSRPAIIRSVVLLPQPDGPTSTTNSPSPTSRSTPCTATTPPSYTFRTPCSVTAAIRHLSADERLLPLPRRLPVGCRDVGLPDRRLAARRRRRPEHLASLHAHPGKQRARPDGRRRVRPLPA